MKKWLLFCLLLSAPAGADFIRYYPPQSSVSGTWDGGAFSAAAEGPTGCAAPAYSFTADTNAGLCLGAANDWTIQTAASGNSRSYVRGTTSVLYTYFVDAGGNVTGWDLGDEAVLSVNSSQLLRFGDTLGSGFLVGKGGATAAVVRSVAAGAGASVANGDGQSGNPTVSVDTATTPQFSSGTGDVPGTGAVGTFYAETDANSFYTYPSTNTEHWLLSIAAGAAQGDLFYASTVDVLSSLAKDTNSTRYLSNQGTSNNPSWNQVNLTNGVTGDLPLSNVAQASGASVLLGRGSAGGAGDFQEITLGTNLSMSGTTLNASGGSSFDPGTTFELYEEFASGELSQDRVGTNGLRYPVLSSGDGAYVASTATHPGQFRLTSSTSDNSGAFISAGGGGSSFHNIYDGSLLNTNDWQIDTVLLVGSNSTAITTSAIWVGWTPSVTGTPDSQGNGIWIRRDTDLSDTAFIFQVCDGAGGTGCGASGDNTNSTVVTSTITPSAGTAYRFRIRYDPTGVSSNPTLYFRVNNETEKTFCSSGCDDVISNMPGSGVGLGYFVVAYFTRDVSTRSGDVDYLYIKVENLSRY